MSKSSIIIASGILVIILPFLGFPSGWEAAIFVILGTIICLREMYGAFTKLYRENLLNNSREIVNDVFTEKRINDESKNEEDYQEDKTTGDIS